jgi:GTPase SAR1 family protein
MADNENDIVGGAGDTEDIGTKDQNNVVVKIGLVGDAQVGKTTLMVKYVENKFDEDYIQTLGKYVPIHFVSLHCMILSTPFA